MTTKRPERVNRMGREALGRGRRRFACLTNMIQIRFSVQFFFFLLFLSALLGFECVDRREKERVRKRQGATDASWLDPA
jgi:hypothetical protein